MHLIFKITAKEKAAAGGTYTQPAAAVFNGFNLYLKIAFKNL